MKADIDMAPFRRDSVHRRPSSHPSTYEADILFAFTSLTKWVLQTITEMGEKVKSSKSFRVLTKTTQPVHAVCVLMVVILSIVFFPVDKKQSNLLASRFTHLTYFTAFSLHVGSQFWMTFVSGLSLYFNLARHAFGDVQRILFPRYFTMNCVLSAITTIQFGRLHASTLSQWDLHMYLQLTALTLCFLVEFCIRIYFVPSVLELISKKTVIEKAAGIGQEVGHYDLGPLLQCPHYMTVHHLFRKVHMYTAIGNIIAIMCSAFHLYYLACYGIVKVV
ncbi:hypothetical protein V9T40_001130 [Parthenolecanium corni]|uniref:TMEM205-like domain-containing protein n=1 Tax=Parthenolecanium corni TaxID=536013 RepID=A0AAN9TRR1_9HEMI